MAIRLYEKRFQQQCGSVGRYQTRAKSVSLLIIGGEEIIQPHATTCSMSKTTAINHNADVINPIPVDAEKNKVAAPHVHTGEQRTKGGKFSGSARQNHPKLLQIKVLHKARAIETVRRASSTAVTGTKQPVNREKQMVE